MEMEMETEPKPFELMDFPNEILENIFYFFDDRTLLIGWHVNKRFRIITNEIVKSKYNGKTKNNFYVIEESDEKMFQEQHEALQHQPFFEAFHNKISAVRISFYRKFIRQDHWAIVMIKTHCRNVTKLIIQTNVPSIIDVEETIMNFHYLTSLELEISDIRKNQWMDRTYPMLTEFALFTLQQVEISSIRSFFKNNPQLESFKCDEQSGLTMDVFNDTNLKKLSRYEFYWSDDNPEELQIDFIPAHTRISLPHLIEICIENDPKFDAIGINCKNIEVFTIFKANESFEISHRQLAMFCSLSKLKEISLDGVKFTSYDVKTLIMMLQELTKLSVECGDHPKRYTDWVLESLIEWWNKDFKLLQLNFDIQPEKYNFQLISSPFHTWFNGFVEDHQKLVLKIHHSKNRTSKITVTKNFVKEDDKIIHFVGFNSSVVDRPFYSNSVNQNAVNIMSLGDDCLNKIIKLLDYDSLFTLNQTCRRLRRLVTAFMKDEITGYDMEMNKFRPGYFYFFGQFMRRIRINTNSREIDAENLRIFQKYCTNLEELHWTDKFLLINDFKSLSANKLQFLKLKKLILEGNLVEVYHRFMFNYDFCPNLEHLEIKCNIMLVGEIVDFGNVFDHLTTIRFDRYDRSALMFLRSLSDKVCSNLLELSLVNLDDAFVSDLQNGEFLLNNELVNTISRFIYLNTLHLLICRASYTNVEHLFESCANLKIVTVLNVGFFIPSPLLNHIRKACYKLEKLQLVVKSEMVDPIRLREIHDNFSKIQIKIIVLGNAKNHFSHGFYLSKEWLDSHTKISSIYL